MDCADRMACVSRRDTSRGCRVPVRHRRRDFIQITLHITVTNVLMSYPSFAQPHASGHGDGVNRAMQSSHLSHNDLRATERFICVLKGETHVNSTGRVDQDGACRSPPERPWGQSNSSNEAQRTQSK